MFLGWRRRRRGDLPLPAQTKEVDGETWVYVSREVAIEDRWACDVIAELTLACEGLVEPFLMTWVNQDCDLAYEVQGWQRMTDYTATKRWERRNLPPAPSLTNGART